MRKLKKSQCQRVSIKYSIVCATVGLAMALLLVTGLFGADALDQALSQDSFITAISVLYAAALILGLVAGGLIYRTGVHGSKIWFVGIGLAWSCLFLSVFIGSSVDFLSEKHNAPSSLHAFGGLVIMPVLWVMLVGGLPAVGLGLLYAAGVKKAVSVS